MTIQQTAYTGQLEIASTVSLATTGVTTIFTGGDGLKTLAATSVINTSASAVVVSLYFYDGTANQIFWRKSVGANDTEIVDQVPRTIRGASQEIRAQAATGSVIEISPTVLRQGSFG